jgi:hypothetical protein
MFDGFELDHVDVGEVTVRVRHGGAGTLVVLLHGHPRVICCPTLLLESAGDDLDIHGDPATIWAPWLAVPLAHRLILLRQHENSSRDPPSPSPDLSFIPGRG